MQYYVALGGNLGDTESVFAQALAGLQAAQCTVTACSQWIVTAPMLNSDAPVYGQNKFLNGVVVLESNLPPQDFLQLLLRVEANLGRVRSRETVRWGPRTIDLDIVAAGQMILASSNLTIPHAELHKRDFVLRPLLEVAPSWRHPILQQTAQEMLDCLELSDFRNDAAAGTNAESPVH